ncbi:response regulator transcription factor [Parendozoicomonas haliclonae]|uniref:Bacterial regulatory protein, luxR family n=1 Tax=Parendozoicomonas haliclonae TaxID=1960125 RepID=A0A1X7AKX1_9GAMM|nr:helix-turn-helix transcriptional regulator [Parendozoicomonas haliclonae]SMA48433.1 Bacterial regulatory protein, luxR family [Parendozoicomonas haliclonae]
MTSSSCNELAFIEPGLRPESPESLLDYFLSRMEQAGLVAVKIMGIPEQLNTGSLLPNELENTLGNKLRLKFIDKNYQNSIGSFGAEYLQTFASSDANYHRSFQTQQSFLYDFDTAPSGCQDFYFGRGLKTTLIVPVCHSDANESLHDWKLRIVLHSVMHNSELEPWLRKEKYFFSKEIRHLYLELMDQYAEQLKPLNSQELHMHPQARRIIELLAEGYSTKAIANKINLTEKGVDYHLNNLRIKLEAKNRTHLVSQAYRLGVIPS